jgi:general stress protein 26
MKLNDRAREVIETWRMGFVATVSADGRPNVSPKATFVIVDDETIAFAELRSPQTIANLAHQAEVEVSIVDVLSRNGVRIRGKARVETGADMEPLMPLFRAHWNDVLLGMINAVVVIPVEELKPLQSPAYEVGADEAGLRASWKDKIAGMRN